jgi:tetratricopeptide (TPR) repeat protein
MTMTFGAFHSSEPHLTEDITSSFFFNKSLQQRGLEYRLGNVADDIRYDLRLVGGALLTQQERAAKRYEKASHATTAAVERQTAETVRFREEQATQARELKSAVEDSTRVLQKSIDGTGKAITEMHGAVVDQLSHVRWAMAEQNQLLRGIFETLRDGRSNECRQLVEQGEKNLQARYYAEAEERLKLALVYDNTDHVLHQNLGLVAIHLGKPDIALEHFKRALAFPPKAKNHGDRSKVAFFLARAATHAARVLYATGDTRGAAEYLAKALEHDDTAAKNWYDLAVMCAYEENGRAVETALRKAIALEPEFYAQALGDPELDPVRDQVDRLLLTLRDETRDALETALPKLAALEQLAASVQQVVSQAPLSPPYLMQAAEAARARATFFALREVVVEMERTLKFVPAALTNALDAAIADAEARKKSAKSDVAKKHDHETASLRKDREDARAADDKVRANADGGFNQIVLAVVGILAGVILGAAIRGWAGAGLGLVVGAFLPPLIYAIHHEAAKGTSKRALEAAEAALKGRMAALDEETAATSDDVEASLRTLRDLRARVARGIS